MVALERITSAWRATRGRAAAVVGAAAVVACAASQASAHPLGMYIFRDANDKLVMVFPWNSYWPLKYRVPPFEGFMDHDYPYEEALGDRPSQNLFRTHPDAKLKVILVDIDPGFWVRDPADINIAMNLPGDSFVIGVTGTGFLTFPWWHLDESDPNYVPNQEWYEASFYLHDVTGIHSDSDIYTFKVYPDEGFCPADLTTTATPGQFGYGVPDQLLTTDDFFYFLQMFAAGTWQADVTSTSQPGTPGYGVPDGLVNNDDYFYYLSLYVLGC